MAVLIMEVKNRTKNKLHAHYKDFSSWCIGKLLVYILRVVHNTKMHCVSKKKQSSVWCSRWYMYK
jgi:hypothetical protein